MINIGTDTHISTSKLIPTNSLVVKPSFKSSTILGLSHQVRDAISRLALTHISTDQPQGHQSATRECRSRLHLPNSRVSLCMFQARGVEETCGKGKGGEEKGLKCAQPITARLGGKGEGDWRVGYRPYYVYITSNDVLYKCIRLCVCPLGVYLCTWWARTMNKDVRMALFHLHGALDRLPRPFCLWLLRVQYVLQVRCTPCDDLHQPSASIS